MLQIRYFERCRLLSGFAPSSIRRHIHTIKITSKSKNNTVEILRHKSEAWKYEEEWRVLKLGKAKQLVGFSRDSLVQIIFGCRCKDQVEIQKMCSEHGFDSVQFSKAEKANDSYKLIVTPLTLWNNTIGDVLEAFFCFFSFGRLLDSKTKKRNPEVILHRFGISICWT